MFTTLQEFHSKTNTTSSDYYFCPKCKNAPKLELKENKSIIISCKCFEISSPIKDDEVNPKPIEELVKYESYEIPIKRYLNLITKNTLEQTCSNKDDKRAQTFCTECQKWLCDQCLIEHNKACNHLTFFSNGMMLNTLCENKDCKYKQKVVSVFYCSICNMHCCLDCSNHGLFHGKTKIEEIFVNERKIYCDRWIKDYSQNIETDYLKYSNHLSDLKRRKKQEYDKTVIGEKLYNIYTSTIDSLFDNYTNLLNANCIKKYYIREFYDSLLSAYNMTKNIFNYNIRYNLNMFYNNLNNITNLNNLKNGQFEKSIKEKFEDYSINEEIERMFFLAEYDIDKQVDSNNINHLRIFGKEFNDLTNDNCVIYIDNKKVPFTKQFDESISGKHLVKVHMKLGQFIKSMAHMFNQCESLTFMRISDLDLSKVTSMEGMFSKCYKLQLLNLSNFEQAKIRSLEGCFFSCVSLVYLDLSNFDFTGFPHIEYLFYECKSLTNIQFNNIVLGENLQLKKMLETLPRQTSIEITLNQIQFPNETSFAYLFDGLDNLSSLTIHHLDTSNVQDMKGMFNDCSNLLSLDFSCFDTSKVVSMEKMFNECRTLSSIDVSHLNTAKVETMEGMFGYCESLESLDISMFKLTSLYNVKSMFEGCTNLSSLNMNINVYKLRVKDHMFYHCPKIDPKIKSIYNRLEEDEED